MDWVDWGIDRVVLEVGNGGSWGLKCMKLMFEVVRKEWRFMCAICG